MKKLKSVEIEDRIVVMTENGQLGSEIAKSLKIAHSTVQSVRKR